MLTIPENSINVCNMDFNGISFGTLFFDMGILIASSIVELYHFLSDAVSTKRLSDIWQLSQCSPFGG